MVGGGGGGFGLRAYIGGAVMYHFPHSYHDKLIYTDVLAACYAYACSAGTFTWPYTKLVRPDRLPC